METIPKISSDLDCSINELMASEKVIDNITVKTSLDITKMMIDDFLFEMSISTKLQRGLSIETLQREMDKSTSENKKKILNALIECVSDMAVDDNGE